MVTMPEYPPFDAVRAREIIAGHVGRPGPELPLLHDIQEAFGHVPEEAIPLIAEAVNRTRAEIHGVVTFYHDFRRHRPGRHVLKLCRAEACQAAGGTRLAEEAERRLGLAVGATSPQVTLEPVYCLGLCAVAPAAMLDGEPVGRLDERRLRALLDEAEG
jgi:formate dehydrogenase subunit gamma